MLKILISPIQRWLLRRAQCVGCGSDLSRQKRYKFKAGQKKVVCVCGRIFIYSPDDDQYRRALIEEVK